MEATRISHTEVLGCFEVPTTKGIRGEIRNLVKTVQGLPTGHRHRTSAVQKSRHRARQRDPEVDGAPSRAVEVHKHLPDKILRVIFDRIGQEGLGRFHKLETVKVVQEEQFGGYRLDRKLWSFKPFSNTGEAPPALRNLILEGTSD